MLLGDVRFESVRDGTSYLPRDYFGVTEGAVHAATLGDSGQLELPIGGFIVHTGGKVVLLDAGLGPMSVEWQPADGGSVRLEGGALPGVLAGAGISPADVDIVLLSHLHADHSGWVWQDGRPYFPNATVRFGRGDWETYVEQGVSGADGDGFRALGEIGRVELIEHDGQVAPNITSLHTPGHTPGHQTYIVSSGGERALFLGDALSCPLQMEAPELEALADMDPELGIATRELIFRELEEGDLISGPHFPDVRWGRVLVGNGRRYWS
jgi:glyoxylase-like metal-dependent hydrolase (beta-lactamase superfamily II)